MSKNNSNKDLNDYLRKVDNKQIQSQIDILLDMLRKGSIEELAVLLKSFNKDELISKLNDIDKTVIRDLKVNIAEIKQKVSATDLQKLSKIIGTGGDKVVKKIKELLE